MHEVTLLDFEKLTHFDESFTLPPEAATESDR